MNSELKRMLAQVSKLTPPRRQELMHALGKGDETAQTVRLLESRPVSCPHGQSQRVVRNGHASGLQSDKYRTCTRSFNALTDTPLARLRHKDKWQSQAEMLRQGLSMHQSARTLRLAPSTAFR